MRDTPISADDAALLKGRILATAAVAEKCRIDLIASPVADVVNCRVEVRTSEARKALIDHYHGVAIGDSIYFTIPWRKVRN